MPTKQTSIAENSIGYGHAFKCVLFSKAFESAWKGNSCGVWGQPDITPVQALFQPTLDQKF